MGAIKFAIAKETSKKNGDHEPKLWTPRQARRVIYQRVNQGSAVPPFYLDQAKDGRRAYRRYNVTGYQRLLARTIEVAEPGEEFFTWAKGRDTVISFRPVLITPPVVLPDQASMWDAKGVTIFKAVVTQFPELRWAGTCVCRDTRQGGSLSTHACCGAHDFWVPIKNGVYDARYGDEVYEWLLRNKKELGWTWVGWCGNTYQTECTYHKSHLHIEWKKCSACS